MGWTQSIRRLTTLSPWTALAIVAGGCGGGDKSPTGPQGGGNVADFDLVALGRAGVPADVKVEDCILTHFYSGGITINPNTNSWELRLKVNDGNLGDWGYKDWGTLEIDGGTVWFDSDATGFGWPGTVTDAEVTVNYDWCENGEPDVQMVFDR
jgi:hypothetical protein